MEVFETDSEKFELRFWNKFKLFLFGYLFFLIFCFNTIKFNLLFCSITLTYFVITILYAISSSRIEIFKIFFDKNRLTLYGNNLKSQWNEKIELEKSLIHIKVVTSKSYCGKHFYLVIKTDNSKFLINFENNWKEDKILNIFETFKEFKNEKIIIDEQLILNSLKEKIKKCQ